MKKQVKGGSIHIEGAKTHNLKNITLDIPVGKVTVLTGVSGSGKSSLALDTLYAEGQRRYIESFSPYARQFLEKIQQPDVEQIDGIFPAIAISQRPQASNPRSTVGTITEIYDYLRLLFAKIGEIHCYSCGRRGKKDTVSSIAGDLKIQAKRSCRLAVFFPFEVVSRQKKQFALKQLLKLGYDTVLVKDVYYDIEELIDSGIEFTNIFVYVDTIDNKDSLQDRLMDALEMAFREGNGKVMVMLENKKKIFFDERLICTYCGIEYEQPEPSHFSFNSPRGACSICQGFGNIKSLDMKKIIPDQNRTLKEKPVEPWNTKMYNWFYRRLFQLSMKYKIPWDIPFKKLDDRLKELIIEGNEDFPGIKGFFDALNEKKYKVHVRIFISRYRKYEDCNACQGSRLKPERLAVRIRNKNIYELTMLSAQRLREYIDNLKLTPFENEVAGKIVLEITKKLQYLEGVGLDYLTMHRQASTLSGGESQRINLAVALGTNLTDTLYILDEPSVGLHPHDNNKLLDIIKQIKHLGNTVVVVEHDKDIIKNADYIIELGPGAGEKGGELLFSGTMKKFFSSSHTLTAQYLRKEIAMIQPGNRKSSHGYIKITGAREHNLKNITVDIPLGQLVCVTGMSGSGKSTLVQDILYAGLKYAHGEWKGNVGLHDSIAVKGTVEDVILVDQLPPSRNPKSIVATYIKAFDHIRTIFANSTEGQIAHLTPAHFSFHSDKGRCSYCEGRGSIKVEMLFLADMYIECDYCKGRRFNRDTLQIFYKGKNIADILDCTVTEAYSFFGEEQNYLNLSNRRGGPIRTPSKTPRYIVSEHSEKSFRKNEKEEYKIRKCLESLINIGLGYLRLGQSLDTLSAGEAQRIKIASFLSEKHQNVLYIFDEPTIGLHFHDIKILLECFYRLRENGNSILVIEHNMNVIRCADHIIDLGPEGGEKGGTIVAQGTAEDIAKSKQSYTGKYIRD
ncbi:MAG: excinuclease ABC subunit A [Candidatus Fischerbacteria bacterium RBG_13_37_8]|uniref:UvrABC system protein A n=1 Tax=Candidatus Fischerbacteria bacterium RBG_13_37_8 TaxID=1817863 RepID=A0A1F5VW31_9BACT|nr:MAG: excinuclease ABC subunit A [Candidatus Fischerbacteria bacterium RBG_13_37_8]